MDKKALLECFKGSERGAKYINKIEEDSYDVESWNSLIKEAAGKNIDEVEFFYEELIKIFPTCSRYWKFYIEHELKFKRFDKVSELFKRSLEEVIHVDLYKCYLNFIKESKSAEPELNFKAFRFALDKVGIDPNSLVIWLDYIQFLNERETDSSYLESQKITALRKAYLEGIANPMFHIENLWKDYVAFEQKTNMNLAEKMTQDKSRDHMNARRVAKEWEVTIRGLNKSWPATPPTFSDEETRQLEIWKKYISWEKSNPLNTENNLIIANRVSYAYKQFLLCFGHHPHVWHEYAYFLDSQIKLMSDAGDVEMSKKFQKEEYALYERAIRNFMRSNLLIHFSFADFLETMNDKKRALEIYETLIEMGQIDDRINLTLVYIQKMKFIRRSKGIIHARSVFNDARKDPKCGHQIYTATALMEHHCAKDAVLACKVFELGMKKFKDNADYILSYIKFVDNLNLETNTHTLFERVLTTATSLPSQETIAIWNCYLSFETNLGDLPSINKVEKRRSLALQDSFPKCTETSWMVDKYKFQDLFPCSLTDLRGLNYDSRQCLDTLPSVSKIIDELNMSTQKKYTFNLQTTNSDFCLPDLQQMLPFKPAINPTYGHTVPGGVFPLPVAVGNLLSKLPSSRCFWGPFVNIDELINSFRVLDFESLFQAYSENRRVKKARLE